MRCYAITRNGQFAYYHEHLGQFFWRNDFHVCCLLQNKDYANDLAKEWVGAYVLEYELNPVKNPPTLSLVA